MSRAHSMALAILGAWLGATLLMWFVAAASFSTVDRVMRASNPQFVEATRQLGQDKPRGLLRFLASEINRTCFHAYGWAQVVLGVLLLLLLLRQTPRDAVGLVIAGAMLVLVLVLTLMVTPKITALGRSIDFVPRNPPPPEMPRFRMLHAAFTGLDGVKLLAGLSLLVRWIVVH